MTKPVITLSTSGRQIHYAESSYSLLETLEQHEVEIEYQCRSGYCGACRARLVKGNVIYHTAPLACIKKNEILTCCCSPKTNIELEI